MENETLVAHRVSKWYNEGLGQLLVLGEVDVTFERRKTYAITGASGTGKSTLLHIMAGLDAPSKGFVSLNGVSFQDMSLSEIMRVRNEQLGLVFQQPYLIKDLSVIENIMMPQLLKGVPYQQAHESATALLRNIGLQQKADSLPLSLSGGQQQRIATLRALSNKPLFLLADEPTGNLDEKTAKDMVHFLLDCQKEWGVGLIVSSHDAYVAQKMDMVFLLHAGRLNVCDH